MCALYSGYFVSQPILKSLYVIENRIEFTDTIIMSHNTNHSAAPLFVKIAFITIPGGRKLVSEMML